MTTLPTNDIRSTRGSRLGRVVLLAALGLFGTKAAQAQTLSYAATAAVNTTGTYTDLGTNGTVIATANTDDANSAPQPIGFTFNFNGTAFTEFVLNTNGLIRLGNAAPSTASLYYENFNGGNGVDPLSADATAADVNLLMPFDFDLVSGTSPAEYRVYTTGTAGSQVCTIQWKNVSDKSDAAGTTPALSQFANFSFQLKLYEGTNVIEFVYDAATASTNPAAARFPNAGLKGSGTGNGQVTLALKANGGAAWSTTTFQNTNYTNHAHDIANVALPDAGRTYRFTPTSASTVDAAVSTVYTLGKLSQTSSTPHVVTARVTNNGGAALTNLPVTLTVSGANTFTNTQTVASLAAGASTTVTFTGYPLTSTGTNTVAVSVAAPGDAVATNNSVSTTQIVGNDLSYIEPATTTFSGGLGAAAAGFTLYTKYTLNGPSTVTAITPIFTASTSTTTTYQVQLYDASGTAGAPGATPIFTSATRPRPTAAGPEVVSITPTAVPATFYVAVKVITANNIGLAYLAESPLRPGTFYFSANGTTFTDISASTIPTARLALEATLQGTPPPTPPANDECATAVALTPAAGGAACTPTNGTVTNATQGAQGPISCGGFISTSSQDVWYSFVAAGTTHTITVNGNFDGVLELLRGTCGSLINVTCSDVAGNNETLTVNNLTAGTTYFVRYYPATANPTNGAFTICVTAPAPTCDPVTGLGVGTIASNSANLVFTSGTGNTSYTITVTPQGGPATTITSTTTNVPLTGLTPNTAYTISVTPICSGGGTATAATTTFNTLLGTRAALAGGFVSVFPNPAHQSFTVAIPAVSGARQAQVAIINSLGQVVRTQAVSLSANATQATVEAANLAAGIYTVRVKAGNETANVRLTIQ